MPRRALLACPFLLSCASTPAPGAPPAHRDHAVEAAGDHHHGEHGGHGEHHGGHHDGHHTPAAEGAPQGHTGHGMSHGFKDAEKWAKVFDDPARDAWQRPDEVVALLDVRPGMTVADLGAGTGYFLGRLVAKVGASGAVIATDLEADMVRYLEQRAQRERWSNVRPVQVTAAETGLAKASVDRILVVDVWHHLGERQAYAAKLAAALRPGGRIAVVDFELTATMGPPKEHRLAPEVIAGELRSAGLTVELAKESLEQQYVVIATAPAR
ncbi:MAG: methyltransferase domain-containing protein [Myxococcales bacterium]|nr:methyltransferase domain-containing protein [Myxococcales bacterium]